MGSGSSTVCDSGFYNLSGVLVGGRRWGVVVVVAVVESLGCRCGLDLFTPRSFGVNERQGSAGSA